MGGPEGVYSVGEEAAVCEVEEGGGVSEGGMGE